MAICRRRKWKLCQSNISTGGQPSEQFRQCGSGLLGVGVIVAPRLGVGNIAEEQPQHAAEIYQMICPAYILRIHTVRSPLDRLPLSRQANLCDCSCAPHSLHDPRRSFLSTCTRYQSRHCGTARFKQPWKPDQTKQNKTKQNHPGTPALAFGLHRICIKLGTGDLDNARALNCSPRKNPRACM